MKKFGWASIFSGSVMDSKRILSRASDEFDMSSAQKDFRVEVKCVDDHLISC